MRHHPCVPLPALNHTHHSVAHHLRHHSSYCRGPFPGARVVQAHMCGRLPRDTLVACHMPEVPSTAVSTDVPYFFRCVGGCVGVLVCHTWCAGVYCETHAVVAFRRQGCCSPHNQPLRYALPCAVCCAMPCAVAVAVTGNNRPLGALLDNVANGWSYNTITWSDVLAKSQHAAGTVREDGCSVLVYICSWLLDKFCCCCSRVSTHG